MQSFSMQGHKRVHHVNFLQPCYRGLQHFSFPEYSENSGKCISITLSTQREGSDREITEDRREVEHVPCSDE